MRRAGRERPLNAPGPSRSRPAADIGRSRSLLSYEATMALGATRYRPALDALARSGLRGEFTQTGGMCARWRYRSTEGRTCS